MNFTASCNEGYNYLPSQVMREGLKFKAMLYYCEGYKRAAITSRGDLN